MRLVDIWIGVDRRWRLSGVLDASCNRPPAGFMRMSPIKITSSPMPQTYQPGRMPAWKLKSAPAHHRRAIGDPEADRFEQKCQRAAPYPLGVPARKFENRIGVTLRRARMQARYEARFSAKGLQMPRRCSHHPTFLSRRSVADAAAQRAFVSSSRETRK